MKSLAALFMLMCLVLVACGDAPPTPTPIPTQPPAATSTPEATATPRNTSTPVPTDTLVPTATPENTPTSESSPTPTVPPFEVVQQITKRTSGAAYIIGVFKYNGADRIVDYDIIGELEDANNKLVATGQAFDKAKSVEPGTLIPFKIYFGSPPEYEHFKAYVIAGDQSKYLLGAYTSEVEISESTLQEPQNTYEGQKVVGRVKNIGTERIKLPAVQAALWDADGLLLDVANGYATIEELDPGQESGFELTFSRDALGTRFDAVVTAFVDN